MLKGPAWVAIWHMPCVILEQGPWRGSKVTDNVDEIES